jgi:membrane fusion protein YbhG
LSLALSALLLLTGWGWPWRTASDTGTILLSGTLEARETDLAFQVSGRIAHIKVDEGDRVAVGDLVAELDDQDYVASLQRAQAEARSAAAALAALKAGTRPQELRVGEATLDEARARLKFARFEANRVAELMPKKLASQQQLDQARLAVDVAAADVAQSEQRLLLLREGPRKEDIDRAAADYAARLDAVELAQQQLEYTKLTSPVAGMVSARLAEEGEVVIPGKAVRRVAELATPWVRAYLKATDVPRVKLGQDADVRVDGLPGKVFKGSLSFISPVAEFTPKTVETRELRTDLVYRIKVDVDNAAGLLKIGMPADVIIKTSVR